jgi:hypothetical protein
MDGRLPDASIETPSMNCKEHPLRAAREDYYNPEIPLIWVNPTPHGAQSPRPVILSLRVVLKYSRAKVMLVLKLSHGVER